MNTPEEEKAYREMMAQYAASITSLPPISFTPEERKVLGEKANAEMAGYYANLTERQNERNAREHLAVLCQALAQQRHRLLPYSDPERLAVAAVDAMRQRLPPPMFLGPLTGERLDAAIVEQASIHFAIPIDTLKIAMHVIQHGLGDEVLVGRITLSEAYERVRAKEQAAPAKAADAIG